MLRQNKKANPERIPVPMVVPVSFAYWSVSFSYDDENLAHGFLHHLSRKLNSSPIENHWIKEISSFFSLNDRASVSIDVDKAKHSKSVNSLARNGWLWKEPFERCCREQGRAHLELVYLVTALVPSETACLASSPGKRRRTEVWTSRLVIVERLL